MNLDMNKFQQLASDCGVLIVITGDAAQGVFELKAFNGSLDDLLRCEGFIGLIGFVGFVPKIALAVELDEAATETLAKAVTRIAEGAMEHLEYVLNLDSRYPPVNRVEAN